MTTWPAGQAAPGSRRRPRHALGGGGQEAKAEARGPTGAAPSRRPPPIPGPGPRAPGAIPPGRSAAQGAPYLGSTRRLCSLTSEAAGERGGRTDLPGPPGSRPRPARCPGDARGTPARPLTGCPLRAGVPACKPPCPSGLQEQGGRMVPTARRLRGPAPHASPPAPKGQGFPRPAAGGVWPSVGAVASPSAATVRVSSRPSVRCDTESASLPPVWSRL